MKIAEIRLFEGHFDDLKVKREVDIYAIAGMQPRAQRETLKTLTDDQLHNLRDKRIALSKVSRKKTQGAYKTMADIATSSPNVRRIYSDDDVYYDENHYVILNSYGRRNIYAVKIDSAEEKRIKVAAESLAPYKRLISASTREFGEQIGDVIKGRETERRKKANQAAGGIFEEWANNIPRKQVDPKNIPKKLSKQAGGVARVGNPYFTNGVTNEYAGHPAHYPLWSNQWKRRVLEINEALVDSGFGGFEMMYAGKHNGRNFNFFIIAAGGDFVWRKYDVGGQSGQNWIFLKGKQGKTTTFEGLTRKKQVDKLKKSLDNP